MISRLLALFAIGIAPLTAQSVGIPTSSGSSESAVYFSGQIQMEDGSPPADPVVIQEVCRGRMRDVARSDSKGHFGFKVGEDGASTLGDASETPRAATGADTPIGHSTQITNPVTSSLRDCQLQAALPGFRSERVDIDLKNTLDSTNVGILILHPVSRGSALSISETTLAAPAGARKAYEKGTAELNAKKWDAAARDLEKAVTQYQAFASAWFELGIARENRHDIDGAMNAWKQALKSDSKYIKPYETLTSAAYAKSDWKALDEYSRSWIQLDPEDFPSAYLFNAFAAAKLGRIDDAEHAAREGLRIDKQKRFPKLDYVLGIVLMQDKKYAESAQCFRDYLALSPNASEAPAIREQLPKLESAAKQN